MGKITARDLENNFKSQIENKLYINENYGNSITANTTSLLSDFTGTITTLFSTYTTIIVPPGNYTLNSTLTIPAGKILRLTGMREDGLSQVMSAVTNTVGNLSGIYTCITVASNLTTGIIMQTRSQLIGGVIFATSMLGGEVVRLNLYTAAHSNMSIKTAIIGSSGFTNTITGILLECDGSNPSGYGVYINIDCHLQNLACGILLHRLTSTNLQCWVTNLYIGGYALWCTRTIYWDTLGIWAGQGSYITTEIQCGPIPDREIPAIEINTDSVTISGNIWDAVGDTVGTQQKYALRLNALAYLIGITSNLVDSSLIIGDPDSYEILSAISPRIEKYYPSVGYNYKPWDEQDNILALSNNYTNISLAYTNNDDSSKSFTNTDINDMFYSSANSIYMNSAFKGAQGLFFPKKNTITSGYVNPIKNSKLVFQIDILNKMYVNTVGIVLSKILLPASYEISAYDVNNIKIATTTGGFVESDSIRLIETKNLQLSIDAQIAKAVTKVIITLDTFVADPVTEPAYEHYMFNLFLISRNVKVYKKEIPNYICSKDDLELYKISNSTFASAFGVTERYIDFTSLSALPTNCAVNYSYSFNTGLILPKNLTGTTITISNLIGQTRTRRLLALVDVDFDGYELYYITLNSNSATRMWDTENVNNSYSKTLLCSLEQSATSMTIYFHFVSGGTPSVNPIKIKKIRILECNSDLKIRDIANYYMTTNNI